MKRFVFVNGLAETLESASTKDCAVDAVYTAYMNSVELPAYIPMELFETLALCKVEVDRLEQVVQQTSESYKLHTAKLSDIKFTLEISKRCTPSSAVDRAQDMLEKTQSICNMLQVDSIKARTDLAHAKIKYATTREEIEKIRLDADSCAKEEQQRTYEYIRKLYYLIEDLMDNIKSDIPYSMMTPEVNETLDIASRELIRLDYKYDTVYDKAFSAASTAAKTE